MTFEEYISGMSTRDLVAQLLCPAIRATYKEDSDPREYFENVFTDPSIKPGSVFFFPSKREDIKKMTKMLNQYLCRPALFCTDMETSPTTIHEATNFGSAMVISAADNADDAYTCGESCANEGLECGLQWALGPVADMCFSPRNMPTRSWGNEPDRVTKFVTRFSDGMEDNGMMSTIKHFPSICTFEGDSHLHASINDMSMDEWMETQGKVWQNVIDHGVNAIMPGHVCFPAAEPDGKLIPTTLSYNVVTKLLREKMGFDGLVVTDGFNMGGLMPYVKPERAYVKAVQAGCDVLLFINFTSTLTEAVDILEKAVNDGELTIERIKESVYRIWKQKKRLGLFDIENKMYRRVPKEKRDEYADLAKKIGKNSISIFKNLNILPLDESKTKKVISIDITNQERPVKNDLDDILKANGMEVYKYGNYTENGVVSILDLPKADAIIVNFYYGPVWAGMNNLPSGKMLQRVYEYIFKPEIPVVMICHGNPAIPVIFPYVKAVVNTFGIKDLNPQALYDVLFGKQEAVGYTPMRIELRQPEIIE